MIASVPSDLLAGAIAGAAAGAVSGLLPLLIATYFHEPKRGAGLLALSTLVGALFGFIAAGIFSAVCAASYLHPSRRAKRHTSPAAGP